MNTRQSSFSSITELFRPIRPKGLKTRNLSSTRLNALKREIDTNLHLIPIGELIAKLQTDPEKGLTTAKAADFMKYYGPNTLTPASENSWFKVLFKSMFTGFSLLIWLGAFLCLTAFFIEYGIKAVPSYDNMYLACVLVGVDVVCGLFSFFQNYKSSKIMKTFKDLIPSYARVVRDGSLCEHTLVRDLVKGDLVIVRGGDIVPADIRILDSKGFKVDNSSLTGESVALSRSNAPGSDNILESMNVAFFSTQCIEGWARGVVLCTGDATALGRVAGLASRIPPPASPLQTEIRRFMRGMAAWAVLLGLLIAAVCLALGYPFMQITIFVIGIIVANIPEGLQPTVTAALTLAAQRMVSRRCVVKRLEAIEALGAVSVVCSDKTGTLTKNQMCVRHVWLPADKAGDVYAVDDDDFTTFTAMKLCGALCSTAYINSEREIQGDASETAILFFLEKYENTTELRRLFPKVAEIPFNSANKYQISIHVNTVTGQHLLVMKGAPEMVCVRCSRAAGARADLPAAPRQALDDATEALAQTGERILAFADMYLDSKKFPIGFQFDTEDVNFPLDGLRLLGIMGLKDPPRDEVAGAVARVRAAGVRVVMVTGDHPGTARAVARECGLVTGDAARVLTGHELRAMPPDVLSNLIEKHAEIVFARTSPMQKLQIVEAFQRARGVVAVTGDGVNDAPALRQAHVGIAMGRAGSQVSKQTADIILLDDNFATIVVGIEEGRKIFDNLKKSVCYILISNVPEIAPVLMFIIFSIPLPLGVMTILCVDLGTDMWAAVALSFERAEADVLLRGPRRAALVSRRMLALAYAHLGLMEFAAGMFAYFVVMAEHGFLPTDLFGIRRRWDCAAVSDVRDSRGAEWDHAARKRLEAAAQAAYFAAVVLMQVTNAVVCKTRYNSLLHVGMRNRCLNFGLAFEIVVACVICYTPGVNDFFRTYPLKLRWWFLATPFALVMLAFDEFRKYCIRHNKFNSFYNKLTYY